MTFSGVLFSCLLVILLMFIGFTGILFYISVKENKVKEICDYEIEGKGKKALVVFHDSPAHTVKRGVDTITKALKKMKYNISVFSARPKLELDLSSYDVICLCGPTYMGKVAKPLIDFTVRHQFKNKRILIYINGQFINKTKDVDYLNKFIENDNIVLTEKSYGNFKELTKVVEKIEDSSLKPKGYYIWEKMKNDEKRAKSTTRNKK